MLAKGEALAAVTTGRDWHDLGTPRRYLRGVLEWGRRKGWVSPEADVVSPRRLKKCVVENGARIEKGCEIVESLILSGARVGSGCRIRESIIGPGVELPINTSVDGRLVTEVQEEGDASGGSSVVVAGLDFKEI